MSDDLGKMAVVRKTGKEQFHSNGRALDYDLLSFWEWSMSDLVSNATRGVIAEYIVARALGLAKMDIRDEWAAYDLQTPSGIKVEVKSAAFVQSWYQKRYSTIQYNVPKTRLWDADNNLQSNESRRQADVYVFAFLSHMDKASIDPLNINQWRFYVLPTSALDTRTRSQHSITLKSVENLSDRAVGYEELRAAVEEATGKPIG
jgi:hypothetical protein